MEKINALGMLCPLPVIEAKNFIKQHPQADFAIDVDNQEAVTNLQQLAEQKHYSVTVKTFASQADQPRSAMSQSTSYTVTFTPDKTMTIDTTPTLQTSTASLEQISSNSDDYIVVISSDQMGVGDEEFGKDLLKNFIYALSESEKLPQAIIFYNKGVLISTSDDEKLLSDLFSLADAGVEILSCGLCLNFYELSEQLKIGKVTNMFNIVEMMSEYRIVKP